MNSAMAGFGLSLSLILAIGAQNAYVLRQGLRQAHVFWICLFCGLSDAVLIWAGISGAGFLADQAPWFAPAMRYGGAAFLIWYGGRNAYAAWRGGEVLPPGGDVETSLMASLATLVALTWLNPHVYLDTVVLIGSISAQYDNPLAFGLGAAASSMIFFFVLGYGARLLTPVFRHVLSWRLFDAATACVMWTIAATLLLG